MHLKELDYQLPKELIADRPVEPRDACRLMVIHRKTGEIEHRFFYDLRGYLAQGDLLVLNSARVTPARLLARIEGNPSQEIEILAIDAGESSRCKALIFPTFARDHGLLSVEKREYPPSRKLSERASASVDGSAGLSAVVRRTKVDSAEVPNASRALVRAASPSRKIKPADRLITVGTNNLLSVCKKDEAGQWELELKQPGMNWRRLLDLEGRMPLPPYILKRRSMKSDLPEDRVWYQTTFADRDGAIAAPTAGLHFSSEMLERLEKRGVEIARIFLKVGIGTFQPVRTSLVEDHTLLPEEYEIDQGAVNKMKISRGNGGRIVAVGTTVVRSLESSALEDGSVSAGKRSTQLLITPKYSFRVIDALITNFHLPKTTLLALVFAFTGMDLARKAYIEAIEKKYRFFSYGDAMLIL